MQGFFNALFVIVNRKVGKERRKERRRKGRKKIPQSYSKRNKKKKTSINKELINKYCYIYTLECIKYTHNKCLLMDFISSLLFGEKINNDINDQRACHHYFLFIRFTQK